jgi:uncharacterized protein (TIGR03382 family)
MKAAWSVALVAAAAALLFWLVAGPSRPRAYTVSSLITSGCHERITTDALRAVRLELATAGPLPLTRDERALVDDLQFTPADDMRDLGGATLLVGVRDNDLKGRSSQDLTNLAGVHGNPDTQQEHCLRNSGQDEPGGSLEALADCRAFIRGRIVEALDGLDAGGAPDPARRSSLPLYLSLRGHVDAQLPTYYVRMGQAIHAVEDSFVHAYRTADGMKITVVLNWVDEIGGKGSESRDGPSHSHAMDGCSDLDELRTTRRLLATDAATALLRATLDPLRSRDEKLAAVDSVLDTYLSYSPGCTFDNGWCDAPEKAYKDSPQHTFGCSSGGGGGILAGLLALLALALLSRPRRTTMTSYLAAILVAASTLTAGSARAAEPGQPAAGPAGEPAAGEEHAPPAPVTVPVAQPGPRDPSEGAWGAYLGLSGSVDKPAAAIDLGIRRKLSTHWTVGWDAEWNPWVSLYGRRTLRPGSFNTYGTVILRFPLAYQSFNLRTTLNAGISYLLFDLYGAPKGSTGYFVGVSPLGLEWKLSRVFWVVINPLNIAVPVPQTKGVPLTYPQYRFSIGLSILAG